MDKDTLLQFYLHWSRETGLPNGMVIVSRDEYVDYATIEESLCRTVKFVSNLLPDFTLMFLLEEEGVEGDDWTVEEMNAVCKSYIEYLKEVN